MNSQFKLTTNHFWAGAFLVLVTIFMLLPLSSGQLIYQQNTDVDLKIPCLNNGTYCSATAYCNITIINPNGTTLVNNQVMTNQVGFFNYTLTLNLTVINGEHECSMACMDGAYSGASTFTFMITPNGSELSSAKGTMYIVFVIGALFLFLLMLWGAVKIPWKNPRDEENNVIGINDLKWVKLFLMCTCYVILMFIFGLLQSITANYIWETGVDKLFNWAFQIMLHIMYPLMVCVLLFALIIFITDRKLQDQINKGFTITS